MKWFYWMLTIRTAIVLFLKMSSLSCDCHDNWHPIRHTHTQAVLIAFAIMKMSPDLGTISVLGLRHCRGCHTHTTLTAIPVPQRGDRPCHFHGNKIPDTSCLCKWATDQSQFSTRRGGQLAAGHVGWTASFLPAVIIKVNKSFRVS